jgi:N-acetylmuramoyl-L-alanine amidase-like protein
VGDPVVAVCRRTYTAIRSSGARKATDIKWIVLHSTEGSTAEGAAAWFTNPNAEGSAHLVVDDSVCFRTLENGQVPWAAPGANTNGFHVEQAGYARWTRTDWLSHDRTLRRSAYKTAFHAHLFNIPLRWVGPIGLRIGRKGVTTHRDVTNAWPVLGHRAGWHTDPGTGFPKDRFMYYAQQYLGVIQHQ